MRIRTYLASAAIALLTPMAAAASCDDALSRLQGSFGQDVPAVVAATAGFKAESTCNATTRAQALAQVSAVLAGKAQAALADGDVDGAEAIVTQAPALHWAVQAVRGDIAAKRGNRREAAQLYNAALDTITDPDLTAPDPRLAPAAERIARLAQENMMLAGSVESGVTRGGGASGVMKMAIRGISIEAVPSDPPETAQYDEPASPAPQPQKAAPSDDGYVDAYAGKPKETYIIADAAAKAVPSVPLPIRFAFGSAELDAAGRHEAEIIANFLLANRVYRLTLVGHTDEIGSEHFNLKLSLARARTVRDFLISKGVTAEIWVDGKGESEPPILVDYTIYSDEERRAIARRVELILHG